MKDLAFVAPNKTFWQRIDKRIARKAYNVGQNIYICSQHDIKDLPTTDTGAHTPAVTAIHNKLTYSLSFDDLCAKLERQTPQPLIYFADSIAIPRFYNIVDKMPTQCPDGQTREGSLFYLCDAPTDEVIKHGHDNGIAFPTVVSQYAPEIRKPTMFIPYGAIAYFE
jgi:hypothetical protein